MAPTALVTVVVPTYNRPWGLKRALRSIQAQTWIDFEVVVMDDASTEDPSDLVRALSDPRFRYFRQKTNVGLSRNWGDGLKKARTPYVCFLMDDDYYDPTFLRSRLELLERFPEAWVAFSGYHRVDAEGRSLGHCRPRCHPGELYRGQRLLEIFLAEGGVFVGAMVYRRECVVRLWDSVQKYGLVVDLALNIRLALEPSSVAVACGDTDFNMAIHEGQVYRSLRPKVYEATQGFLRDLIRDTSGPLRSYLRSNYGQFLLGWAYAEAGCRRASALRHWLESLWFVPRSRECGKRLLYVLALILGLRRESPR